MIIHHLIFIPFIFIYALLLAQFLIFGLSHSYYFHILALFIFICFIPLRVFYSSAVDCF